MKVVWIAAIAAGALFAGAGTSRAQNGGPYPPPYIPPYMPPAYTERQVIPNLPPDVNLQPSHPWDGPPPELPPALGDPALGAYGCPPGYGPDFAPPLYSGYANQADVFTGWYLAGMLGAVYLEDQFSEAADAAILREQAAAFDWNLNGGWAVGYRWPTRPRDIGQLRVEFDSIYNKNRVKTLVFNGVERDARGEVSANSFMFNAVLDMIHWNGIFVPYVGGGIGVVRVTEQADWPGARVFGTDAVFGFQAMAGLSVKLWENVEWFTEWRYLGGSNPKFTFENAAGRVELQSEYNTHSIMSGLRINLP